MYNIHQINLNPLVPELAGDFKYVDAVKLSLLNSPFFMSVYDSNIVELLEFNDYAEYNLIANTIFAARLMVNVGLTKDAFGEQVSSFRINDVKFIEAEKNKVTLQKHLPNISNGFLYSDTKCFNNLQPELIKSKQAQSKLLGSIVAKTFRQTLNHDSQIMSASMIEMVIASSIAIGYYYSVSYRLILDKCYTLKGLDNKLWSKCAMLLIDVLTSTQYLELHNHNDFKTLISRFKSDARLEAYDQEISTQAFYALPHVNVMKLSPFYTVYQILKVSNYFKTEVDLNGFLRTIQSVNGSFGSEFGALMTTSGEVSDEFRDIVFDKSGLFES